jgi:cytochrome c-type biogenesis protein CcmH/NrfG
MICGETSVSLQQAVRQDPLSSAMVEEPATTYMQLGRYADAELWSQRALALNPDNRNAKSNIADAILFSTGDIPSALLQQRATIRH